MRDPKRQDSWEYATLWFGALGGIGMVALNGLLFGLDWWSFVWPVIVCTAFHLWHIRKVWR